MVGLLNLGGPAIDFSPLSQGLAALGTGISNWRTGNALVDEYNWRQGQQQGLASLGTAMPVAQEAVVPQAAPTPQQRVDTAFSAVEQTPQMGGGTNGQMTGGIGIGNGVQIPGSYYAATRSAESGGNPNAKNPRSSATGLYQFTTGTWNNIMRQHPELGLTPNGRTDPAQQERAMQVFTQRNAKALEGAGIPITGGSLYAAHFLGAGGARKVLRAPDQAPVSAIVGRDVVNANPFLANMSVGEFRQWSEQKGGGAGGSAEVATAMPASGQRTISFGSGWGSSMPPPEVMIPLLRNPETRAAAAKLMREGQTGNYEFKTVGDHLLRIGRDGSVESVFNSATGPGGGVDRGLNPQFGVDANGNPVLLQLGKDGTAVQTALPDGVSLSKEPIRLDTGTSFILLDPITRQRVGEIPKDVAGEAREAQIGKTEGEAIANAPEAINKADGIMQVIDGVLNDPALANATGIMAWRQAVPGTEAYRFGTRARQLEGQAFLQAFESLKGGGQITEVEGQKATQAIGRLSTSQSAEDYRAALQELRGIVQASKQRAAQKTGTAPVQAPISGDTTQQSPKRLRYNPATGNLE